MAANSPIVNVAGWNDHDACFSREGGFASRLQCSFRDAYGDWLCPWHWLCSSIMFASSRDRFPRSEDLRVRFLA